MPLVAENTIAPVSAVQNWVPRRSDQPVQTSTTGSAVQVYRQCAAAEPRTGKQLTEGAHRASEVRVGRPLDTVRERRAAVPFMYVRHRY